jgi:hypothetical protein
MQGERLKARRGRTGRIFYRWLCQKFDQLDGENELFEFKTIREYAKIVPLTEHPLPNRQTLAVVSKSVMKVWQTLTQ